MNGINLYEPNGAILSFCSLSESPVKAVTPVKERNSFLFGDADGILNVLTLKVSSNLVKNRHKLLSKQQNLTKTTETKKNSLKIDKNRNKNREKIPKLLFPEISQKTENSDALVRKTPKKSKMSKTSKMVSISEENSDYNAFVSFLAKFEKIEFLAELARNVYFVGSEECDCRLVRFASASGSSKAKIDVLMVHEAIGAVQSIFVDESKLFFVLSFFRVLSRFCHFYFIFLHFSVNLEIKEFPFIINFYLKSKERR